MHQAFTLSGDAQDSARQIKGKLKLLGLILWSQYLTYTQLAEMYLADRCELYITDVVHTNSCYYIQKSLLIFSSSQCSVPSVL